MGKTVCCLLLLIGLTACQPKGSYRYHYPAPEAHPIKRMVVVIDYLNLRDDIGKYWDYDSFYHEHNLNLLLNGVEIHLQELGYPAVEGYLLSSGLLFKEAFAVEHYHQDENQEELLYPPFTMAQHNIPVADTFHHQEIMSTLVKYIAQRRHHASDSSNHRGMQLGYQVQALDLPTDTGILYLHINTSAPGAVKHLGALLLGGAIASQADYGHLYYQPRSQQHASAFLLHHNSGQILWKNFTSQWTPDQPIAGLLEGLSVN